MGSCWAKQDCSCGPVLIITRKSTLLNILGIILQYTWDRCNSFWSFRASRVHCWSLATTTVNILRCSFLSTNSRTRMSKANECQSWFIRKRIANNPIPDCITWRPEGCFPSSPWIRIFRIGQGMLTNCKVTMDDKNYTMHKMSADLLLLCLYFYNQHVMIIWVSEEPGNVLDLMSAHSRLCGSLPPKQASVEILDQQKQSTDCSACSSRRVTLDLPVTKTRHYEKFGWIASLS